MRIVISLDRKVLSRDLDLEGEEAQRMLDATLDAIQVVTENEISRILGISVSVEVEKKTVLMMPESFAVNIAIRDTSNWGKMERILDGLLKMRSEIQKLLSITFQVNWGIDIELMVLTSNDSVLEHYRIAK